MKNAKVKKLLGVILIIIFSLLNLLILLVLVSTLVEHGDDPDILTTVFTFIFTFVLFYFPLQYGITLWKSGVSDLLEVPSPSDRTITTSRVQITFQDYRALLVGLTFKSPLVLYLGFLGIGFLVFASLNPSGNAFGFVIGIVFILIPFSSILQAKRNYNSSKNLKEIITYEFTADTIIITGETFNTTMRWTSLYKVKELNDWLLLYTNKIVAVCVPKSGFASEADLQAVKSFALSAKGVKKELKTNNK